MNLYINYLEYSNYLIFKDFPQAKMSFLANQHNTNPSRDDIRPTPADNGCMASNGTKAYESW
jgi:hypothetical protein